MGQSGPRRELISCNYVLFTLDVSIGCDGGPTETSGMKNSLLLSTVNGSHYRESARKYQGRTASLANGEVWTNSCKNVLFFAASMPATAWSITGKIILTALLPYSLITAHPQGWGCSKAILGGCAFFIVMSYDVLICQIKYMSQHFHLLPPACLQNK